MTLISIFGFGIYWLNPMASAVTIYCFTFIINLFYKLYYRENYLTKLFFGYFKMPMYLATAMVVLIIFLRKSHPEIDFRSTYASVTMGLIAGIIGLIVGMVKQRNLVHDQ